MILMEFLPFPQRQQPSTPPPYQSEDGLEVEAELAEPRDPSVVLQRVLPYTARSYSLADLPADAVRRGALELCVLAQDSAGNVRRWRRSQCRTLPAGAGSSLSSGAATNALSATAAGAALGVALLAAARGA